MTWPSLKYGFIYFTLVFTAGFILGTLRVLAVEPAMGSRNAELLEMPVMLFVIFQSARYVVAKMPGKKSGLPYFLLGLFALALMLFIEFTLVLTVQGISIGQYLDDRDDLAFGAYAVALVIFAVMPWLVKIGKNRGNR